MKKQKIFVAYLLLNTKFIHNYKSMFYK